MKDVFISINKPFKNKINRSKSIKTLQISDTNASWLLLLAVTVSRCC